MSNVKYKKLTKKLRKEKRAESLRKDFYTIYGTEEFFKNFKEVFKTKN